MTIAQINASHKIESSVSGFLIDENKGGFNKIDRYKTWSKDVRKVIDNFGQQLLALKKEGRTIAGFAASAKGNTLLNSAGINTDIMDYIVDQTPEKIGKYSPGTGIPIVHIQTLTKKPCDYLVILAWNFADELMTKARENGFKGAFIIPIPEWTVIN
jgi:hypothetical protein